METQKPLLKDEDGEEVDVHMYRLMIGSLMYLTSSRPDIMFAVCACARYQVNPKVSHLYAVKKIFRYLKGQPKLGLWYLKDSPFDLVAYTDSDYAGASLDRKSTTREKAKKSVRLMMEKLVIRENRQRVLVRKRIERIGENKNRKRAMWNKNKQSDLVSKRIERNGELKNRKRVEYIKNRQSVWNEIEVNAGDSKLMLLGINLILQNPLEMKKESLGEDASKQGRINAIDVDEDITLVNDQDDADMFDVNTLTSDEVLAEQEVATKDVNMTVDEVTTKVSAATTTTTAIISTPKKGIVITKLEPEKPLKKKDQISFDEQEAIKLQAEFDEAKVDADYQLVQRMQAKEQEQFTTKQKATLLKELLEQRRKHFAAKRAEEERNKPPTKTQQKKTMITYLENMEDLKHKDLKSKDFDSIKELFNKTFKRVNMFVDYRIDLVEAEVDDQEAAKIKELMEIVPDEEEVAIDSITLAFP
ncbi:hypothetical protein Tco_0232668 [Tanacetum coccineum]